MRKNNEEEAQTHINELLKLVQSSGKSPLERSLEVLAMLGVSPRETLELRLSSPQDCNLSNLAQRAVNAFFMAFHLHPNVLVAHSTVASLFIASEQVFTPTLPHEAAKPLHDVLFGTNFIPQPVRIVPDNNLDTRTIAVRFELDTESEEVQDAAVSLIKKLLFEDRL